LKNFENLLIFGEDRQKFMAYLLGPRKFMLYTVGKLLNIASLKSAEFVFAHDFCHGDQFKEIFFRRLQYKKLPQ